jgi:hypothetical protein
VKNAAFLINKWLLDCVQELGRAAAVLGMVFWITDQPAIDPQALRNFSLALDRIPFVREITDLEMVNKGPGFYFPPPRKSGREEGWIGGKTKLLESAVQTVSSDLAHRSLVEAVDAAKRNMVAFASVLRELEAATIEAGCWMADFVPSEEVVQRLRLAVEDVMLAETGQAVNQHVLR